MKDSNKKCNNRKNYILFTVVVFSKKHATEICYCPPVFLPLEIVHLRGVCHKEFFVGASNFCPFSCLVDLKLLFESRSWTSAIFSCDDARCACVS